MYLYDIQLHMVLNLVSWNTSRIGIWTILMISKKSWKLLINININGSLTNTLSSWDQAKKIFSNKSPSHLSAQITDFYPPLCDVVSVLADQCPKDVSQCGSFQWELSANLTDGNGTGIESISLRQGNGTLLHTALAAPVVVATYNASCCSQIVEFAAVDKVGNVGKCYHSIVGSGAAPAVTLWLQLWICLLVSVFVLTPWVGLTVDPQFCFVPFFWKQRTYTEK